MQDEQGNAPSTGRPALSGAVRGRILAIDVGNSRLKWGFSEGGVWIARGRSLHGDIATLPDRWRPYGDPEVAIVANVAGDAVRGELSVALGHFRFRPTWLKASASQCGVSSHYHNPAQLGPDRWAALIAARQVSPGATLVVNAGTATTIDCLTAGGEFLGGLILPGLGLMLRSLNLGTALIGDDAGHFDGFPRRTRDAVYSGAVQATVGAIDRQARTMEDAGHGPVGCVLTGGASDALAAHLGSPPLQVETLVLDGLRHIAETGLGGRGTA
jgi:type III pantothenate kinase